MRRTMSDMADGVNRGKVLVTAVAVFAWSVAPISARSAVQSWVTGHGDSVDVAVSEASGMPDLPEGMNPALRDPARTLEALRLIRTVKRRPSVAGFDRSAFGAGWKDPDRNGCDARNDMLRRSLVYPVLKAGSRCVVVGGTLHDPYTGTDVAFTKARASAVQIDHLFPLSAAWDLGASQWTSAKRVRFANDPINLVAVQGTANQAKSDQTPGAWVPVNRAYACTYIRRVALVALAYDLPLPVSDMRSMRRTAETMC